MSRIATADTAMSLGLLRSMVGAPVEFVVVFGKRDETLQRLLARDFPTEPLGHKALDEVMQSAVQLVAGHQFRH